MGHAPVDNMGFSYTFVERFVGGHVAFCQQCSNQMLSWVVLGSRLVPAISFDLVSYGAGLTKLGLGRFVAATFIGSLPLTFAYTAFGAAVWSWLEETVGLAFGLLAVVALVAGPWALEHWNVFGFRERIRHGEA